MTPDEFMAAQQQPKPMTPDEFMASQQAQPVSASESKPPAKPPGALSQIGTSLGNAAIGLGQLAFAASPFGSVPINDTQNPNAMESTPMGSLLKGTWEGQAEQYRKALDEKKKGNYGAAALRSVAAGVPLVGPFAAQTVDKWKSGKPWEAATDVALMAAPFGVEEAAGRMASRSAAKAAGASIDNLVRGVKPRSALTEFRQHAERAMPDMKSAEADLGRPIGGVRDAIDAADAGLEKNWNQFNQYLDQAAQIGATIDGSPIADARIASIPSKLKLENPQAYQALVDTANKYRGPLPIKAAQQLLAETNAAVKSYYMKFPGERYAERASDPSTAADVATGDTLRNLLYDKLDQISGGAGVPSQLKARYGSLKQVRGELMRRQNVAERQQPQSLLQQGGNLVAAEQGINAVGKVLTGNVGGAALDTAKALGAKAVANTVKNAGTSDALIRKAFQDYRPTQYGSLTGANLGQLPPPVPSQPKGLLGPAPRPMPPPADTSGPIPPVLPRGIRIRPDWVAEGKIPPERQLTEPAPIGPNDPWQRGNPPRNRPTSSVVPSAPYAPQAKPLGMDEVVNFAHENKMPVVDAMSELSRRGYRINPMPEPQPAPRQAPPQ
jgi:hypothetical protein